MIAGIATRGLTLEDGPVLRLERRYAHAVSASGARSPTPRSCAHWFPVRRAARR